MPIVLYANGLVGRTLANGVLRSRRKMAASAVRNRRAVADGPQPGMPRHGHVLGDDDGAAHGRQRQLGDQPGRLHARAPDDRLGIEGRPAREMEARFVDARHPVAEDDLDAAPCQEPGGILAHLRIEVG